MANSNMPRFIRKVRRAVPAICEHIMSNNALPGRCIRVRIDKSTNCRIVIPALEVVESGFLVVDVPTIPQGVDICQSASSRKNLAIGVIVVACDNVLAAIHNPHHVTLEVGDIIVDCAVVLHGVGCTIGIIEEVNGIGSPGHAHQLAAGVIIAVSGATHSLAGSQAVCIVGKAQAAGSVGGRRQTPAILPRHCPPGAVVVAGGVANGIIGNAVTVKGSEQILPVCVAVGVTVSGSAIGRSQDIARTIVGIGVGRISRRFQQLALVVVGVGNGALPGSGEGCDITHAVIGIAILLPAAGHRRHLQGSLGAVNIPVGILPGDGAAGNGSQPPQAIVAHSQGIAHTGGHGVQAAIGRIVGVSLRIRRTIQLPVLVRELVIGVVVLAGAKDASVSFLLLAVK